MPSEFAHDYDLSFIVKNGKVLEEIRKGMHRLHQTGKIAYEHLNQHMLPYGHVPTKHTPGLWHHTNSNIKFNLIFDDFGAKHTSIAQVKYLIHVLQQKYEIIVDWTGTLYARVSLDWDYINMNVKLSMPGRIRKVLIKCSHPTPNSN